MKRLVLISAVLLFVAYWVIYGCGQVTTGGGGNTGIITGKVSSYYTGVGIAKAIVMVGLGTVTVETDGSGNYSINAGTTGTVTISAAAAGYGAKTIVCNSSTVNFDLSPLGVYGVGKYGTIRGRLLNADGTAYPTPEAVAAFNEYGDHLFSCTNGGNGYWIKTDCPIGNITLIFWQYEPITYKTIGIAYKTGITLTENGSVDAGTLTIQPISTWKTLSGTITPPSSMALAVSSPDYHYVHVQLPSVSFPLVSSMCATADYSLKVPPSVDGNKYVILASAYSTAEGYSTYTTAIVRDLSVTSDSTQNFTLPEIPTITAPAKDATVSSTPTFSWSGNADLYSISIFSKSCGETIWSCLTTASSQKYPAFPSAISSTLELTSGQQYSWILTACKTSGFDINNYGGALDLANKLSGVSVRPSRNFTVQ